MRIRHRMGIIRYNDNMAGGSSLPYRLLHAWELL